MAYLRCRNCGRYLLSSEVTEEGYCSSECSEMFRACSNCGGYFQAGGGHGGRYCCPECAVQYKMSRFMDAVAANTLTKELA